MKRLVFLMILFALAATAQAAEPELEAKGAILMDFDTGRVLYEKNSGESLAMASTTKIMTAILAIEKCGMGDVVTVSKKASLTPPTKAYLQEGERQTMEDLLYGLMLESANDAAVAIAEHVGGSVEGFAELMNKKAVEIGAVNTEFVTPNGLDLDNHSSTAKDMALIARYALGNKDFRRIVATRSVTTPVKGGDFKAHSYVNKDRLLYEYNGALGVKTGYTGKAGHCFVGAAERDGMLIVSVVLGSGWGPRGKEQKWVDTKRLLDYGFGNYKNINVAKGGELVKNSLVEHSKGNTVDLRLKKGLTLPLQKEEEASVEIRYALPEILDAPVLAGEKIGEAQVYISGKEAARIDVVADKDVERFDFNISCRKILDNWFNMNPRAAL